MAPRISARASLPTTYGPLRIYAFEGLSDGKEHLAVINGVVAGAQSVPTRVHSQCMTGDILASLRCDCREQLDLGLRRIAAAERGLILYMRQEGRGIGIGNKIRAYALQDAGFDTVDANRLLGFEDDERDYSAAAEMLECLGVRSVKLMTNNPDKVIQLENYGITVEGRLPHEIIPNRHNLRYLQTKQRRSGHLLGADIGDTSLLEHPEAASEASEPLGQGFTGRPRVETVSPFELLRH
jgi:GTP cyclohydrolase II